jgi:hypothetical protein
LCALPARHRASIALDHWYQCPIDEGSSMLWMAGILSLSRFSLKY